MLVHGILPGEEEERGRAGEPVSATAGDPTQGTAEPEATPPSRPTAAPWAADQGPADHNGADSYPAAQDQAAPDQDEALVAEAGPRLRAALDSDAAQVSLEVIVPLDALVDPDSTAVAHLPGFGPISAEHARELAATADTTIHRLLTDPADGRCVERSTTSYRPDRDMLDQLRAADRTCRSPGCTRDVAHAQPDHVQPWAQSRWTSEANLAYEHSHHHHNLTLRLWASQLRADRTMTFSTLFGRIYTTRSHDYRDYHPLDLPTTPTGTTPTGTTLPGEGPPGARPAGIDPDLGNRLIYAALAHRRPGDHLVDDLDDHHTCDDTALPTRAELRLGPDRNTSRFAPLFDLRHRTPGGAIRPGPPAGQPTVHDILHPQDPEPPPPPAPPRPPPPF